ncbi:MAG TPA: response regulator [Candidatus Dormibacteraeota bacterium]|nr:response regulator [Candidatus Dormibacteraeota bacterium]
MADELQRLREVVGIHVQIGERASIGDVTGAWAASIDSVNALITHLALPTSETARVIGAVARGDLSQTMPLDSGDRPLEGEFLRTSRIVNTMVDQLGSFASEVTRVAREVGTEGKLGGQAEVRGAAGTWKDLTDSVNLMAGNLTAQVRNIAAVTTAVANGDLSKKITVDVKGEILELKNTINTMVDQLNSFAAEVTRVAREVGTEGKLGGQADVRGVAGTWKDLTDNVNFMAANLTGQVRNIADVTTAVASGDLSKKIIVDVKGEILELKNTVNTMVDQLSSFAAEVTRVAREVGTEGKLGGQAEVKGVSGTWKDLTDNVNYMASNLTGQVRGIAKVVTAVANGDLKQKLTVDAKGEIAALADTINGMIDTLATFADQVTGVARAVGVEGKLGGQASVPGAAGTWKDLTENVNQLAANLTTQVRAIAEVATAVTTGDLTRSIKVDASGEVASLKDNINEMIRNLKDTTQKNSEQNWLKTNLAKFSRMLQGQKDQLTVGRLILSELAPVVTAQHGVFYILDNGSEDPELKLLASYAHRERKQVSNSYKLGEGLVGQCALEKEKILLSNVPSDYIQISSGLGMATPTNVIVLPVIFEGQVKAVLELASFERFNTTHQAFLDQLTESIGIVLNTIEANTRTEDLLKQSQSLARELQSQQEELRQTNQKLEEKAGLLAEQNAEVERKNSEVEQARQALEEKAKQLALTSKYKSEFLANMSHELRTPLNSLLILSDQLSRNLEGNLQPKQVDYASTIHSSGTDLLMLINDILDLSKIESGTVTIDVGDVRFADLHDYVERTFRPVAEAKALGFTLERDPSLPPTIHTDAKRLQQVIKNLLSNAFKFTEQGGVTLQVQAVDCGWSPDHDGLNRARSVIAFTVSDTGIGIPVDKQQIIFEAFQQADGSTSRMYGGTGLGLAISREIARLLGGEIRVESEPGVGSRFTLLVPQTYAAPRALRKATARAVPPAPAPVFAELPSAEAAAPPPLAENQLGDDRQEIQPGDHVVLIVDNDENFARYLFDLAHERGFKAVVTTSGAAAVALARDLHPDAITLDIRLPDVDGLKVLSRLKGDLAVRHIPVHVISTDENVELGLRLGARSALAKPIQNREALEEVFAAVERELEPAEQSVMLVGCDEVEVERLRGALDLERLRVLIADSADAARRAIATAPPDAVVVATLADGALDLVEHLTQEYPRLPLLYVTAPAVSKRDEAALRRLQLHARVRPIHSLDRLLDQAVLALHRRWSELPSTQREAIARLYENDSVLAGRKVLVVDDDIRNIFALTSVLEREQMEVVAAETGQGAIDLLQANPDVDIALMDIMMPGMDGYETMRAIRHMPKLRHLPIIAVTAKAMKGDREKTIEAGAWDYLSKPVDAAQMLAVMRAWLRR